MASSEHVWPSVMNTFLGMDVDTWLDSMRKDSFALQREINNTPKWRKIKRYHLLERLYKLDEYRGLIAHVLNDDEGY